MKKTPSTTEQNFSTFVKEIKSKILSSQYEALKAVNLWNMRTFYTEYRGNAKLRALTAQIGWTHNLWNTKIGENKQ